MYLFCFFIAFISEEFQVSAGEKRTGKDVCGWLVGFFLVRHVLEGFERENDAAGMTHSRLQEGERQMANREQILNDFQVNSFRRERRDQR